MTTPNTLFSRILSLAIQGKLVDNSADEDADALLSRIKASNTSKKKTSSDPIKPEECPFEIPDNWKWVRLGEICDKFMTGPFGSMVHKYDYVINNGVPLVNPANIVDGEICDDKIMLVSNEKAKELDKYRLNVGDIIIARRGDLSKCAVVDENHNNYLCGTGSFVLHIKNTESQFFKIFYTSKYTQDYLTEKSIGSTMDNLNQTVFGNLPLPLPPLAVQSRIVAKLDEIKSLIDECVEIEADLDKNAELLRKKVLDKAIRGRLTTQLPSDGDAQTLIDQISAEKAKSSAKNKKQTPPQPINPDDQPFQIPVNWKWVRLGEIGETNTGSTPSKSHPEYYGNFIPFLSPGEIQNNTIVSYNKNGLSKDGYEVARPTPNGTVLQVCIGGSIGKCAIIERECCFNQQINSITPFFVLSKYVYYTISSEYFVSMLVSKSTGSATPIINKSAWEFLLLPLPPLAEQSRIVAKIGRIGQIAG